MKRPAPKFVFLNRSPGLFEPFDYRAPYAFDSFAKWIMNTVGRRRDRHEAPGGRGGIGAEFLGLSGRGSKRRPRD